MALIGQTYEDGKPQSRLSRLITLLDQSCVEYLKWQLKRAACERTNCLPSPDPDESLEQPKDYLKIPRSAQIVPIAPPFSAGVPPASTRVLHDRALRASALWN
jgi:hypothetical protein